MENFIVSARKYRPSTFNSVVGQHSITATLKNAIRSNHLAQAFLFCGPRGVGKTTCARILAKTINCTNLGPDTEACNTCESCVSFNNSQSLNIYELDAASNNSVEDIRSLTEQVRFPPHSGKYKIYIIDEVHMLSTNAFNAFLKTLEEPPPYAIFILATTEKHKIIPTILSRCQIFDFSRIQVEDIATHLAYVAGKEGVEAESDALHIIAQKADGALRDALSIFDQIVSFAGNKVTYKAVLENLNILDYEYYFRITAELLAGNISSALLTFDEIMRHGFDGHNFIGGLCSHFRDLLVCRDEATLQLLEVSPGIREKYKKQAAACSPAFLLQALDTAGQCDMQYKTARNQRFHVELCLLKLSGITHPQAAGSEAPPQKKSEVVSAPAHRPERIPSPAAPATAPSPAPAPVPTPPPAPPKPSTGTLSITEMLSRGTDTSVKNPAAPSAPAAPALPFTEDQLLNVWKEYSSLMNTQGKLSWYNMLIKRKPILKENFTVEFTVDSRANIVKEKADLAEFLRKKLNNFLIQVDMPVSNESLPAQPAPYTPSEKFKKMAEKNPGLNDLKKQLDLEIDL